MPESVRIFPEADVKIFLEDEDGVLIDESPILTYCFAEGIRISSVNTIQKRGVTGRGRRKNVDKSGGFDDIQISIEHLFIRKEEAYNSDQIFKGHQYLQIWLDFNDVSLSEDEQQIWKYSGCKAVHHDLNGRGDQTIDSSATFSAERKLPFE